MPFCDIVMKGGVTSGVVYPLAIDEISRTFRFKNVGGTSAGAIAACLTAAAEFRREISGGREGFDELTKLPDELGKNVGGRRSFLLSLFEPHEETSSAFGVASAFLGDESTFRKVSRVVVQALLRYPHLFAIAMIPFFAVLCMIFTAEGAPLLVKWISGLLTFGLGLLIFALSIVGWIALRTLPHNRFGLCTGDKLMAWLHRKINSAAGQPLDRPLTFGDLADKDVRLRMVATNLTHGRPYEFPQEPTIHLYFDDADMLRIFPLEVVAHMKAKSPSMWNGKYELPKGEDLPIVFAARLSLSFPVLFELVPLYAVDRTWGHGKERLEVCWFIDGGLTSNFPIHLFDSTMPKWPTFGLDLREEHPAYPASDTDECKNVWMVKENRDGLAENWNLFAPSTAEVTVGGYLGAIINTMQNWRDNAQQRIPGYRDRIAHLIMRPQEGGLNLNMSETLIKRLAKRGRCAGEELVSRFSPGSTHTLNWNNHRWVRYLVGMSRIERAIEDVRTAFANNPNGGASYQDLVDRKSENVPKTGYFEAKASQRKARKEKTAQLIAVQTSIPPEETALQQAEEMPKPMPVLQITPRF